MPIMEETDDENGSPTLKLKQRLRQERKEIEELFKKQAGVIKILVFSDLIASWSGDD